MPQILAVTQACGNERVGPSTWQAGAEILVQKPRHLLLHALHGAVGDAVAGGVDLGIEPLHRPVGAIGGGLDSLGPRLELGVMACSRRSASAVRPVCRRSACARTRPSSWICQMATNAVPIATINVTMTSRRSPAAWRAALPPSPAGCRPCVRFLSRVAASCAARVT